MMITPQNSFFFNKVSLSIMDLIGCYPNLIKVVADALKLSGLYLK